MSAPGPSTRPSTRPITRAIVPAAGRGTRMRPASLAYPKELVALGARPALLCVLEEAAAAGITDVALVVRPGKEAIGRFLQRLDEEGGLPPLAVTFVEQAVPTGLADAIALCRRFTAGAPFALMLPDNVLLSPRHRLARLLATAGETNRDALGVIAVGHEQSGEYGDSGRIDHVPAGSRLLEIQRLHDKRPGRLTVAPGETVLRTCGRSALLPHVFDAIEASRERAGGGELSEVPALQAIVRRHGALGVVLPPPLFDVGHPRGVLAAGAWLHQHGAEGG